MGATWLQGKFKALDWRDGIDEIQRQADYKYGYNDGYSGAANTCNFVSKGGCYSMKEKEIAEFIEQRKENLGDGMGEVLKDKVVEYAILTTEFEDVYTAPFDTRPCLLNMKKGPGVLVNPRGIPVGEGTVAELKKRAHNIMRQDNYRFNYYIVSKKKTYFCTYKAKYQRTTQRESDDKYLVLPVHEYIYYGWGRC